MVTSSGLIGAVRFLASTNLFKLLFPIYVLTMYGVVVNAGAASVSENAGLSVVMLVGMVFGPSYLGPFYRLFHPLVVLVTVFGLSHYVLGFGELASGGAGVIAMLVGVAPLSATYTVTPVLLVVYFTVVHFFGDALLAFGCGGTIDMCFPL